MKLWKSLKVSIGRGDPRSYSQDLPQWGGQGFELDVFKSQTSLSTDSGLCTERGLRRVHIDLFKPPGKNIGLKLAELPTDNPQPQDPETTTEPTAETEPEILDDVLGDDPTKTNKYCPSIHNDIASRWGHLTKEGLNKDTKNGLLKSQLIPENCQFLEAPILNPEIKAAISDPVYKRDRVLVAQQNILGQATACIGVALNSMLKDKVANLEVTKTISNAGRILCDLFHTQSCARRSLIQFALNKDTKDIVLQTKIERQLFGDNLNEALKAGKAINKTGSEIRYAKPQPDKNAKGSQNPSLNYRGPPRKQQQRPPGPSAGRTAHVKQINRPAPQRPPVQSAAPSYKNRR